MREQERAKHPSCTYLHAQNCKTKHMEARERKNNEERGRKSHEQRETERKQKAWSRAQGRELMARAMTASFCEGEFKPP